MKSEAGCNSEAEARLISMFKVLTWRACLRPPARWWFHSSSPGSVGGAASPALSGRRFERRWQVGSMFVGGGGSEVTTWRHLVYSAWNIFMKCSYANEVCR